eukprot:GHVP01042528.1.p1 GENE.GHVP01042528.1~~GHVP01042528.1.p1  ORF type:complete len:1071 (-),score=201.86 GHVP01042528.1:1639-4851(-)
MEKTDESRDLSVWDVIYPSETTRSPIVFETPLSYFFSLAATGLQENTLFIFSEGLDYHGFISYFIETIQGDAEAPPLIFLLGMSNEEISILMQRQQFSGHHNFSIPEESDYELQSTWSRWSHIRWKRKVSIRNLSAETTQQHRVSQYCTGGCISVPSSVLATDLLSGRVAPDIVDAIIICHAERVTSRWNDSFCIRLLREKEARTRVIGISDSPTSFLRGFSQVERVMKSLLLQKLSLVPRFRDKIESSFNGTDSAKISKLIFPESPFEMLEKSKRKKPTSSPSSEDSKSDVGIVASETENVQPETRELTVDFTPIMKSIQSFLVRILVKGFVELQKSPNIDLNDVIELPSNFSASTTGNSPQLLSSALLVNLTSRLDKDWWRMPQRLRRIISDVQVLRKLLLSCSHMTCVDFLRYLRATITACGVDSAWTITKEAESLFEYARNRVFNITKSDPPALQLKLEPNPKWKLLLSILYPQKPHMASIPTDMVKDPVVRTLIIVSDSSVAFQIRKLLSLGNVGEVMDFYWRQYLIAHESRNPVPDSGKSVVPLKALVNLEASLVSKEACKISLSSFDRVYVEEPCPQQILENDPLPGAPDSHMFPTFFKQSLNNSLDKDSPNTFVLIHEYSATRGNLRLTLRNFQPHFVVLYEPIIGAVRTLEEHFAAEALSNSMLKTALPNINVSFSPCRRVTMLSHNNSAEGLLFLESLKNEKKSWEALVRHKTTLVVRSDLEKPSASVLASLLSYEDDGTSQVKKVSDLNQQMLALLASDAPLMGNKDLTGVGIKTAVGKILERSGVAGLSEFQRIARLAGAAKKSVIVDSREFKSMLPFQLHCSSIDIKPVLLTVGDYVLSREICVERKTIPDLIGSLNSGRLYQQIQSMQRYYQNPVLLIEWDTDKTFSTQTRDTIGTDVDNQALVSKLILIMMQFPNLKLLWSPNPMFTAKLFLELKEGRQEPILATAVSFGTKKNEEGETQKKEKENTDDSPHVRTVENCKNEAALSFLQSLPGVLPANVHLLLRKCKNLREISKLSEEDFVETMGSVFVVNLNHPILDQPEERHINSFRSLLLQT